MTEKPPADVAAMRFNAPWRPYQERLLGTLPRLLEDRRLHLVAAPGSGRTVIGLELFRRLASPTVVLSPTRTIRDQLTRIADFLPDCEPLELKWCSRDLRDLRFFNALTYQALNTRVRQASAGAGDVELAEADELLDEVGGAGPSTLEVHEVTKALGSAGIRTVILDEAHHLRSDWWAAINQIVRGLDGVTLISLTATPPYDVVGHEWDRYLELCGPIDEEISVPELVKAGTLCPHEDYVWLTEADGQARSLLRKHRSAVELLRTDLLRDELFHVELAAHPAAARADEQVRQIANDPDTEMAIATVLAAVGRPPEALMAVLDVSAEDLADPPRDTEWERMLREYMFGTPWVGGPDAGRRRNLANRLRGDGLLTRRELGIAEPGRRWPQLSLSATKVEACVRITDLERRERGRDLRKVILVDYIRDDSARDPVQRELSLGAWPVFCQLGRLDCRQADGPVVLSCQATCGGVETRRVRIHEVTRRIAT